MIPGRMLRLVRDARKPRASGDDPVTLEVTLPTEA